MLFLVMFHTGVHPLSQPGTADLSAWVDFSSMRMAAEQAAAAEQATAAAAAAAAGSGSSEAAEAAAGVDVHGPVPQADLLHSLGIQHRLEALAQVGLLARTLTCAACRVRQCSTCCYACCCPAKRRFGRT
jgi:SAM-dependent MidA family methyltransferase